MGKNKIDERKILIVTLVEDAAGLRVSWVQDKGQFFFPEIVYKQCNHKIFGKEWIVHVDTNMADNYMGRSDCVRAVVEIWERGLFSDLGEVILNV